MTFHGLADACILLYTIILITILLMDSHSRLLGPTRITLITVLLLTYIGQCLAASPGAVQWQPAKLSNGSPVLFRVITSRNATAVAANWLGHSVSFFHAAGSPSWYGLAGVPLTTAPGIRELEITETLRNGKTLHVIRKVRVGRAIYPSITVKVAKQYTEPSTAQLAAISADKDIKQKVFESVRPDRLWSGRFLPPVSATISDIFGTARVFNQEVQSRHQGMDYAVPAGTEVRAINSGTVLLARPMFFEGNFIVVDHGQGLLSLYLHLSEFKVKEGETVRAGQVIALSGGTGRATGAHLHLAVRWQGVYLNPAILLKLQIPAG